MFQRFLSKQLLSILFLGFSSGLPLALTTSTLQAWFAAENANILTIGMLSLVGQPYVYKFLWAPLLDRYIPPLWGRRRGWIALMQVGLTLSIGAMAFGHPSHYPVMLSFLALAVAFLSATQDIAIDAYRTDVLKTEERGLGAALTITGYRIAMLVSGGMALIIANRLGFQFTYLLMAMLMLINLFITWCSNEPTSEVKPLSLKATLILPWQEFRYRPLAMTLLLFLIFYKIGDAYTISLSSAFFIQYLHFSLATVGMMYKIVGLCASIAGGIIGGILLKRYSLYKGLMWFGSGQAICSFFYMGLAIVGKNIPLLGLTVFTDYLFAGMSGAALIAFITSLCNKQFSATQFAIFSAITTIPRVFIGPFAAISVTALGWVNFFIVSFFMSLPGLWLLWRLRNSYDAVFTKASSQES